MTAKLYSHIVSTHPSICLYHHAGCARAGRVSVERAQLSDGDRKSVV